MKPFFTLNSRKPSRWHFDTAQFMPNAKESKLKKIQLQRDGKLDAPMLINENAGDRPNIPSNDGTPSNIRGEGRQDA
jgi:hypothetical protein